MSVQRTYSFRALDASGKTITGTVSAESPEEVGARLRADGKFVLEVDSRPLRVTTDLDPEQIRHNEAARNVRREDVIAFCQQLSIMLETGVPLTEALESFRKQTPRKDFRQVLAVLCDDIYGGEQFSTAMAKWPKVFPGMMVSLMKASEASGTMAMMLGRVGTYLAKERRTARQIKGALTYPFFMMGIGVLMTVFLMAFVLPRFAKIYEMNSATLPLPTKALLSLSDLVTGQYLVYGPVLGVLAIVLGTWFSRPGGRRLVDWFRLNAPVLRSMYVQLYITRFSRTMATLLAAGVSLLDVIEICRGVTNNDFYDKFWDDVTQGVRDGKQISDLIGDIPFIPANVASMIASGERSGRLPEVMERVAEFSEEELENSVKQITSFIEPIMIVTMGVVVGLVALALLLPIFSMGRVVSGN
ncbi:MAG: type II secretion system F family protein [Planctomycetota bacterium]|jgi:type II secretory pathway component PulF